MELFRSMAGMNLIHVQTGPGQTAPQEVANGNVLTAFASITNGTPIVKAGKVRALAVTSVKRNAQHIRWTKAAKSAGLQPQ
jgi:tripartite-type tricarboxylate transporter receptor subunit TctC